MVCDFGLGRRTDDGRQVVAGPQNGLLNATAPEVLRGEPYDYSADTYSFGILVWDLTLFYMRRHGKTSMPELILEMILGCIQKQKEERITLSDAMTYTDEFLFEFETDEDEPKVKWVSEEKAQKEIHNVLGVESEGVRAAASNFGFLTYSWGNSLG